MIFRTAGRERADTGCTSGGGVCALYRRLLRKQRLLYPPAAGTPDGAVTLPDDDPARQRGLPFIGYCRPQCAGIGAFFVFSFSFISFISSGGVRVGQRTEKPCLGSYVADHRPQRRGIQQTAAGIFAVAGNKVPAAFEG